jgi:glycosyltransferase involved in cell wall biosynthesis
MANKQKSCATRETLLVGGLHMGGSGYPNAQQTLKILHDRLNVESIECGAWLPESLQLWRLAGAQRATQVSALIRLMHGNLLSVIRVLRKQGKARTLVYLPYPAIFFLWWCSWIPARLRPRCIADAYISIWDSMYRDRSIGEQASWPGRITKAFESRALRSASLILVDTLANKRMYAKEFHLDENSIVALPLAVDDEKFLQCSPDTAGDQTNITVLFVGTLIPLHGVQTILDAMKLAMQDPRIHFYLIGDGQLSPLVEEFAIQVGKERFTWARDWEELGTISERICSADICLGVFGGQGKAARVLPFKVYMYLACGRAIISQADYSLPDATPPSPMLTISSPGAQNLADAVTQLANDKNLREKLALDAHEYYIKHLGHKRLSIEWRALLSRLGSSATHD